ncbi:hypothetical protein MRX96_046651 [Rhipicephalus microplus]
MKRVILLKGTAIMVSMPRFDDDLKLMYAAHEATVHPSPIPRRRVFGAVDSNDWTTNNLVNITALSTDDFPNLTDLADKTNVV